MRKSAYNFGLITITDKLNLSDYDINVHSFLRMQKY